MESDEVRMGEESAGTAPEEESIFDPQPEPDGEIADAPDQSIEDLAAANGDLPQEEEAEEPMLPGQNPQLSLLVGGEPPTSATMKLTGGSIDVEGEYPKGARVTLIVEARVGEITFADKMDNAGYVKATERRHTARIESVRLSEE